MTRTVALLGATGYTGRLVAAELTRKGIPHRLGGRSDSRLAAVPSTAPRHVVDLGVPASLDAFLDGTDVLITCVGPFTDLGMPVVEAAVRTGTAYVDSTGEFGWMAEVYRRFRDANSAVVPACGFDYLPGDLAAAVAAAQLEAPVESVDIVYRLRQGKATRGTARSALAAAGSATMNPRRMVVDGPDGPLSAVQVPWGEQVTVPLHLPGARVRTGLAAPDAVTKVADVLAPVAGLTGPLLRLGRPLLDRLVERLPEGPADEVRGAAQALVVVQASAGDRRARVAVTCRDAYGLTARMLVAAALQVTRPGAMAPAEAFEPWSFLDGVSGEDSNGSLSWAVL